MHGRDEVRGANETGTNPPTCDTSQSALLVVAMPLLLVASSY